MSQSQTSALTPCEGMEQCRKFLLGLAPKDGSRELWIKQGHDSIYRATWDEEGNLAGTLTALRDKNNPASRVDKGKPIPNLLKHLSDRCQREDGGAFFIPTQPQGLPTADHVVSTDDIGIELDHLPVAEQIALYQEFTRVTGLEFASLLTSGGASIHAHLKLDHHASLIAVTPLRRLAIIAFNADPVTERLHQPMRLPGFYRREKGQYQELISTSDQRYSWEQIHAGFEAWFAYRGWAYDGSLIEDQWWSEVWFPLLRSSNPATPGSKLRTTENCLAVGQTAYLARRRVESEAESATVKRGGVADNIADAIKMANDSARVSDFEGVDWGNGSGGHYRGQCPFHQGKSGNSAWLSNSGGALKFHCCGCTDDNPRDLFEYYTARQGLTSISDNGGLTGKPWVEAGKAFLTGLGYTVPDRPVDKTIRKNTQQQVAATMGTILEKVESGVKDAEPEISEEEEERLFTQQEIREETLQLIESASKQFEISNLIHPSLAEQIKEVADKLQVPPVSYLHVLLPIAGSLLKVNTRIEISRATAHYAPPILWNGIVASSGESKSVIFNLITKPLRDYEEELSNQWEQDHLAWEAAHQVWMARGRAAGEPEPIEPKPRSVYFQDATLEGMAADIANYPRCGAAITVDELGGFFNGMDQYKSGGKGNDRQKWLSCYDGHALKSTRKTSKAIKLHRTSISMTGTIQPEILQKIMGNLHEVDGLWARFIWLRLPKSKQPAPEVIESEQYCRLPITLNSLYRDLDELAPMTHAMTYEARAIWREWHIACEDAKFNEDHPTLRSLYPKIREQAARIALIAHSINSFYVEGGLKPLINADTIRGAIAYAQYCLTQAKILYSEFGAGANKESVNVLKFVERFTGRDWVTPTNVRRTWPKAKKPTADEARDFMASIVKLGYAIDNGEQGRNYKIKITYTHGANGADGANEQQSTTTKGFQNLGDGAKHDHQDGANGAKHQSAPPQTEDENQDKIEMHHLSAPSAPSNAPGFAPSLTNGNPLQDGHLENSAPFAPSISSKKSGGVGFRVGDRVTCVTKALGNRGGLGELEVTGFTESGNPLVKNRQWLDAIGSIEVTNEDLRLLP